MKEGGARSINEYNAYVNGGAPANVYGLSRQTPDSGLGTEEMRSSTSGPSNNGGNIDRGVGGGNGGSPTGQHVPPGFNSYYGAPQGGQNYYQPQQEQYGSHRGKGMHRPSIMTMHTSPPSMEDQSMYAGPNLQQPTLPPPFIPQQQQQQFYQQPAHAFNEGQFGSQHSLLMRSHSNFSESSTGTMPQSQLNQNGGQQSGGSSEGMMGGQAMNQGHHMQQQPPMYPPPNMYQQQQGMMPMGGGVPPMYGGQMTPGGPPPQGAQTGMVPSGQAGQPVLMQMHPMQVYGMSQGGQGGVMMMPAHGGPPQQPMHSMPFYPQQQPIMNRTFVGQNAEGYVEFSSQAAHPSMYRMMPANRASTMQSPVPSESDQNTGAPSVVSSTGGPLPSQSNINSPNPMQWQPEGPPMQMQGGGMYQTGPQFARPAMGPGGPGLVHGMPPPFPPTGQYMVNPMQYAPHQMQPPPYMQMPPSGPPQQRGGGGYRGRGGRGFHNQGPSMGKYTGGRYSRNNSMMSSGGGRGSSMDRNVDSKTTTPTLDEIIGDDALAAMAERSLSMGTEGPLASPRREPHKQLLQLADNKNSPGGGHGEPTPLLQLDTSGNHPVFPSAPSTPRRDEGKQMLEMRRTPKLEKSNSIPSDPVATTQEPIGSIGHNSTSPTLPTCHFCKSKGSADFYHELRDRNSGICICPALRAVGCEKCGVTGDLAHSAFFCKGPVPRDEPVPSVPRSSKGMNVGGIHGGQQHKRGGGHGGMRGGKRNDRPFHPRN